MSLENRRKDAILRRLRRPFRQVSINAGQSVQLAKLVLLMRKRCSVCQGANCSHAQYYLQYIGIAIAKTVVSCLEVWAQNHKTDGRLEL